MPWILICQSGQNNQLITVYFLYVNSVFSGVLKSYYRYKERMLTCVYSFNLSQGNPRTLMVESIKWHIICPVSNKLKFFHYFLDYSQSDRAKWTIPSMQCKLDFWAFQTEKDFSIACLIKTIQVKEIAVCHNTLLLTDKTETGVQSISLHYEVLQSWSLPIMFSK